MKKPYLAIGVIALGVLIIVVLVMFVQQGSSFVSQVNQVTSSLFASSTTATSTATSTAPVSPTTSVTTSTTKTKTPTPVASGPIVPPKISKFEPAAATVGTTITITGVGFDHTTNYITFGNSQGRHHTDGTADNVIATIGSADGKTLTFTVPTSSASGLLCDASNHCLGISATKIVPGNYPITVRNKNGTSPVDIFTVNQ